MLLAALHTCDEVGFFLLNLFLSVFCFFICKSQDDHHSLIHSLIFRFSILMHCLVKYSRDKDMCFVFEHG